MNYALFGYLFNSFGDAIVRTIRISGYNFLEVAFYCCITGILGIYFQSIITSKLSTKHNSSLKTKALGLHIIRALVMIFSGTINAYAINKVSLSTFYISLFTIPIWSLILEALFTNSSINIYKLSATFLGFVGVLSAFYPFSIDDSLLYIILLQLSPLSYASGQFIAKWLPKDENILNLGYYRFLVTALVLVIPTTYYAESSLTISSIILFFFAGLLFINGTVLVGLAYQKTYPSIAGFAQYSQLIWGALFSYIIWNESIKANELLGGTLTLLAGVLLIKSSSKKNVKT